MTCNSLLGKPVPCNGKNASHQKFAPSLWTGAWASATRPLPIHWVWICFHLNKLFSRLKITSTSMTTRPTTTRRRAWISSFLHFQTALWSFSEASSIQNNSTDQLLIWIERTPWWLCNRFVGTNQQIHTHTETKVSSALFIGHGNHKQITFFVAFFLLHRSLPDYSLLWEWFFACLLDARQLQVENIFLRSKLSEIT
jgi:hypothetical protein